MYNTSQLFLAVIPSPVLPAAMLITSKGQVTIPQRIRDRYGLKPGTSVEFITERNKVQLRPKKSAKTPVDDWLQHATGARKGKATTAQLLKLTRVED